jgi:hypothetical protein
MSDSTTFTAEHRAFQREMVLQYEDGSFPISAWNESTLAIVAGWYASNLTRELATQRYEQYYHRSRRRLQHRLTETSVAAKALADVDAIWESLLTRALDGSR